ncbi:MAG: OmpH family outer membrane protein [Acidobacteriota bacterium]|nr:OmpH family outer membrane protein [Acidobacteriota bacterium]
MKTFRLIAAAFFFAAIFAVSTFAQTAPTATFRIAVINTAAFDDDKGGLTRYVTAANSLETEFKPLMAELQTMANKYQALQAELQTAQANQQKNPNVPIAPITAKDLQAKADEYDKLGRELKFKQDDAKARYERREQAVLAPIRQDIGNAIQEFTKQKGYAMVLDAAKLDGAGLLLGFDEKYDVTKEFITFYNARPAGTATTAAPK